MHCTTIFTAALVAAASINAQSTWTTSSLTTTTLTKTVEKVLATITATGVPPPEYEAPSSVEALEVYTSSSSSSAPAISVYSTASSAAPPCTSSVATLSSVPYGYSNGTVAPSGTGASSGGVPSQTYVPPVSTGAADCLCGVNAVALAAFAGMISFAFA